ncbi:MAG: hypothetical protein HDR12_00220, partial [Lachnospiraceae bacterium]|nr:hypothetical protein [Lachnospiraceae bacterium]
MRGKRILRIIGIAVIVIIVVVILGLYIAYEWKKTIEIYKYGRNNYNYKQERTNEEFMAIVTDNQEDFEYVARTMRQWSDGYIDFYDNYGRRIDFENVTSNNQEIADEISNNADFYKSLKNLYDLDEIRDICVWGDT